jgi:hypothetical protein
MSSSFHHLFFFIKKEILSDGAIKKPKTHLIANYDEIKWHSTFWIQKTLEGPRVWHEPHCILQRFMVIIEIVN